MASADLLRVLDEAHARQLPALIAEWAHGPNRRIARSLRVDLALLTERPELVVPCIYRRCSFGDPTDRMNDWASRVDGPWLRALRAPILPIESAVIEEYRTGIAGNVWCSDDGERIGVAGETSHIAWERATGRRIDGALARPAPKPRPEPWKLAWQKNTWGDLVLERGDEVVQVVMSDDHIVRSAYTLGDHEVLVTGDDMDQEHFYGLVDTRRASFRWRNEGRIPVAAALDAEHVIVAREGAVDIVRIATGETTASWRCPPFDQVLPLPDGNVAMRSGHVIRVWNVGEAIGREQASHRNPNSWTPAEFSPDGTRLVTGDTLCDGEKDHYIARLDCNGPRGWVEGGPPRNCQRLCNGAFVEITPFGLTLWDSRDGRLVLRDRDRRATMRDTVAFDPIGQYVAIWRERGALQLHRLRGALVRELEQPTGKSSDERKLGFSADGSLLAWETANGERFALSTASRSDVYRLARDDDPWEKPPRYVEAIDGMLVVEGVAIPFDDRVAVVHGTHFAGPDSHFRRT